MKHKQRELMRHFSSLFLCHWSLFWLRYIFEIFFFFFNEAKRKSGNMKMIVSFSNIRDDYFSFQVGRSYQDWSRNLLSRSGVIVITFYKVTILGEIIAWDREKKRVVLLRIFVLIRVADSEEKFGCFHVKIFWWF